MPLTSKGQEIMQKMQKEYGPKKGESVFYASRNKGTISGVDKSAFDSNYRVDKGVIRNFDDAVSRRKE